MILSIVLSLSVTFGMPIAARLRQNSPQTSEILWFLVGTGIGFLVLVALWLLIAAATWLVWRLWRFFVRGK